MVDLQAAINYVKTKHLAAEVILVGSSYSSALIFPLATEHPNFVKGIAAFSPGEYFPYKDKPISAYAKQVDCPVFITSTKSEQEYWQGIFDSVTASKQFFLPEVEGFHGSKALWSRNEGYQHYWNAFKEFLSQY